jgi:hypothetical protein
LFKRYAAQTVRRAIGLPRLACDAKIPSGVDPAKFMLRRDMDLLVHLHAGYHLLPSATVFMESERTLILGLQSRQHLPGAEGIGRPSIAVIRDESRTNPLEPSMHLLQSEPATGRTGGVITMIGSNSALRKLLPTGLAHVSALAHARPPVLR